MRWINKMISISTIYKSWEMTRHINLLYIPYKKKLINPSINLQLNQRQSISINTIPSKHSVYYLQCILLYLQIDTK